MEPTLYPDPWRFQAHLEIWVLTAFLVGAYVYAVRVIGPKVAPEGRIVSRGQIRAFVAMIVLLWLSSDWPVHDLAEEYLYSVHMVQHMALSMFVPPLALMATPEWLARILLGKGRTFLASRFLSKPVVAAFIYNIVLLVTHIPALVNRSAQGGPVHYLLHVVLVGSALLLWTPVVGPIREWQMSHGGRGEPRQVHQGDHRTPAAGRFPRLPGFGQECRQAGAQGTAHAIAPVGVDDHVGPVDGALPGPQDHQHPRAARLAQDPHGPVHQPFAPQPHCGLGPPEAAAGAGRQHQADVLPWGASGHGLRHLQMGRAFRRPVVRSG